MIGAVTDATRQHERAYPLYDGKPHNWRRVVTNRVKWNHDARVHLNGKLRADLWHAVY